MTGSPEFSNIGNKRSGTTAVKADNATGGSKSLGIYVDDNSFEKFYRSSVTAVNPVADSLKDSEYGIESDHVQPYINKFKTVDVCFSMGSVSNSMHWNPSGISFGNWRDQSGIKVHENVMLQLSDMNVEASITENYDNLWDKVMGNQIISKIDNAASGARMFSSAVNGTSPASGKAYPKYKNVLVLKDISTLSLPSTVTFVFNYGSAGLYSCEQEVVRPILALVKWFSPRRDSSDSNFVEGIVPSNEYALSVAGRRIVNNLLNNAVSSLSTDDGSENESENDKDNKKGSNTVSSLLQSGVAKVADTLTQIQNALYDATNEAAEYLLKGGAERKSKYRFLTLRIGRLVLPSMIPNTIKWKFDFTQVDEYGFPYKGEMSFDGLQTVTAADSGQIGSPAS